MKKTQGRSKKCDGQTKQNRVSREEGEKTGEKDPFPKDRGKRVSHISRGLNLYSQ